MANKYAEFSKFDDARRGLYKKISRRGFLVCAKKRAFPSQAKAQRFLERKGYPGSPYHCEHCHMWHNTTKDGK